jgi:hypothetical protein
MHDAVDKLMKKANPVWQVILGLSRYPVFFNHGTYRTHGNKSSHRYVRLPWFLALRRQERVCGRRAPVSGRS